MRPQNDRQPMVPGSRANRLSWMSTRLVFHRQSLNSGSVAMAGRAHLDLSATSIVQLSLEVLAGLLQNRSAFSHNVIPDQLFSITLPYTSILSVRALTRGSPPASDR